MDGTELGRSVGHAAPRPSSGRAKLTSLTYWLAATSTFATLSSVPVPLTAQV